MAVALVGYCLGGCFYQRTVMHARGWRQIPHFAAWAGVVGFFWVRMLSIPFAVLRVAMVPFRRMKNKKKGRFSRSSSIIGGGGRLDLEDAVIGAGGGGFKGA